MYHKLFRPVSDWDRITNSEFWSKLYTCWRSNTFETSELNFSTSNNIPHEVQKSLSVTNFFLFCEKEQIKKRLNKSSAK